jgi:serine/threonine protein kinase
LAVSKLSGSAPIYAAPDLAVKDAKPTVRSDIYSLGATLYHMITGKPPYEGSSPLQTLMRVAQEELAPPSSVVKSVPEDVDKVVMAMLAVEPKERHSEMGGVVEDLQALGADKVPTPKAPKKEKAPPEPLDPEVAAARAENRRKLLVGAMVAAGVFAVFAAAALTLVMLAPDMNSCRLPRVNALPSPAPDAPIMKEDKPAPKTRPAPRPGPRRPIGGN